VHPPSLLVPRGRAAVLAVVVAVAAAVAVAASFVGDVDVDIL